MTSETENLHESFYQFEGIFVAPGEVSCGYIELAVFERQWGGKLQYAANTRFVLGALGASYFNLVKKTKL